MKMQAQVLSQEERKTIHNDAIKILEEVGVKFPSEMALSTLEQGGAKVDYDQEIAFISESMVKATLGKTPKEVRFGARDSNWNFTLPADRTWYNLDGCGVYIHDYKTGKRRDAVLQDIADSAKVFDAMDMGNMAWPAISPGDVPQGPRSIIATSTVNLNCSKHVMDEVKTREEVPFVVELSKAIAGGDREMRQNPMYSVTYCTVAPLSHDQDMLEATMDLSRFEAPILVYPMPATGTTGPAGLYSNVAMAVAEALSTIVCFQLYSPGCPLIFGAALGSVNVKSGIFLEGSPEMLLQSSALKEMSDYYNMPNIMAGCLSDAKEPGLQTVMEKVITTLPQVMQGADMIQGMGMFEASMILSLEQIVIDNEIAHLCKRIRDGIDVSPEKNLHEDIKAVGPDGHFLKQKSTRKLFRSDEHYRSDMLDRDSYDEWAALGCPDLMAKAHTKVQEILAAEQRLPMDPNLEQTIREIMEEASAKLK